MAKANSKTRGVPPRFDAAITEQELANGEKAAQSWGVTRRVAYSVLARSSEELRLTDQGTAEAILKAAESLGKYLKWRERETELLKAAQARMFLVLKQYVPPPGGQ